MGGQCETFYSTDHPSLLSLSQIPIKQSDVMDDIEKWLALDDEVNFMMHFLSLKVWVILSFTNLRVVELRCCIFV